VTHALYAGLVEQSRQPVFYAGWGVPDSRGGRLEMVTLHAMLVLRRLRREGPRGGALAQDLLDLVLADLERHLREWGVGEPSMGREMKKLVQSFYARLTALDPLLDGGDPAPFDVVLRRNVYAEATGAEPQAVRNLGTYLLEQDRRLAEQDGASLLAGRLAFAPTAAPPPARAA
jgi:cytochrome b pre-mRNA-processing protein 3